MLWGVLVDHFPSSRQSTEAWLLYVSSALRVVEYAPQLREQLLSCIIERLTQLDVDLSSLQLQLLTPTPTAEEGEEEQSVPSLVTLVDRRLLQSVEAVRVDSVLCLLLSYLQRLSSSASSSALCDEVFSALLRVFNSSILPTVGVRVVQWVMFYHCSLRHSDAESFLRWLLERTFDRDAALSLRLSCVDYTQSFIARAAFIRHPSAMLAFTHIMQWTTAYAQHFIRQAEESRAEDGGGRQQRTRSSPADSASSPASLPLVGPMESAAHALFYRCFQCLLYVFVYRWRAFDEEMEANAAAEVELHRSVGDASDAEQRRWGEGEADAAEAAQAELLDGRLTRPLLRSLLHLLVSSPLDPLRYSTPFIVREFSRLARGMDLIDLRPALRRQRWRRRAEETAEEAKSEAAGRGSDASAAAVSRLLLSSHSALQEASGLLGHRSAADVAPPTLRQAEAASALSAAFPFDPYFLPASAGLLLPLYNHYQPPPPPPSSPAQQRRVASLPRSIASLLRSATAREKRKVEQSAPEQSLDADMEGAEADAATSGEREERRDRRERRQRLSVDWMEEVEEARSARLTAQPLKEAKERKTRQEELKHSRTRPEERQEEEGNSSPDSGDAEDEVDDEGNGGVEVEAVARSVQPTFSPGFGPSLSHSPLAPASSPSAAASTRSHFLSLPLPTARQPPSPHLDPSASSSSSSPLLALSAPTAPLSLLPPSARSPPSRTPESLVALQRPIPSKGRSLATFTQRG